MHALRVATPVPLFEVKDFKRHARISPVRRLFAMCRLSGRLRGVALRTGPRATGAARRAGASSARGRGLQVWQQTALSMGAGAWKGHPQDAVAATPQQKSEENNYTYRENASSAGADSSCSAWADGDISMARYVSQKYETPFATATLYSGGTKSCWTAWTGDQT